jgi:hypothetical protein
MALSQKFRDAALDNAMRICNVDMDKPYAIHHAERVEKKYGLSVLISVRENEDSCVKVFLPRRYSQCFSEKDISSKMSRVNHVLIYKGLNSTSKAYILQIDYKT